MNPAHMTKKQLIEELTTLRRRMAELENQEAELHHCRQTLHATHAQLSAFIKAFEGLMYVCSQQYRIEFMNEKLIERSGHDGTGELCYQVLHERDSICPWCVNDRVFQGETVRWEIKSPRDGRWYYAVNTPIYHADGKISKQSLMLDITAHKLAQEALQKANDNLERLVQQRTEELVKKNRQMEKAIAKHQRTEWALRESEEKYRSVVDHIGIGVALISPAMEILTLNCQMKKWFPAADVSKKPICYQTFNRPPRREICSYCPTFKTLQDGQVHESVTETPDGIKIKNFRIVSTPVRDKDDRIIAAIEMVEDITERKRMQERLQESEILYRTIFETTASATAIIEADTTISLVNTEYERLSGYAKADIEGKRRWTEFVAEDDLARMLEYHRLRRDNSQAAPRNYEFRIRNKRGRIKHAFITVAMLPGTGKSVVSLLDVTERKLAQEALQHSEKQLRFLSSRLMEAQEDERKRIARDLHDSIGQSLLVVKLSVAELLKSTGKTGPNGNIAKSLQRLIPLIQNSVDETRKICTGLRPSILDDLGIIATIAWFYRNLRKACPFIRVNRKIKVNEDEIPEPLKIVIFRILQEALNNIVKYSKANLVNMALFKRDGAIELTIQDNGVGFDLQSMLAKDIRERGLGLCGMQERTELSGGRFEMASTPRRGTRITAIWPA